MSFPWKEPGGYAVPPRGEIIPPRTKKKDPYLDACKEFRADLEMAARQCIRIRGPRAAKAQGAEQLWLERLEQWLEAGGKGQ